MDGHKNSSNPGPDGAPNNSKVCEVPDCGRQLYARALCQTHHRQLMVGGELRPIRPYRQRRIKTVKVASTRLTPECADAIKQLAATRGLSVSAVITDIVETWFVQSHEKEKQRDEGTWKPRAE